jgi:hypothetical protein
LLRLLRAKQSIHVKEDGLLSCVAELVAEVVAELGGRRNTYGGVVRTPTRTVVTTPTRAVVTTSTANYV